jgi:hypothetical protein
MFNYHHITTSKREGRGQSFVELALVFVFLLVLLVGVVEFGLLINNYLHVLDATREAARVNNSYKAFDPDSQVSDQMFYYIVSEQAAITASPVSLTGELNDDIVISVITLSSNTFVRYPLENSNGWSFCEHYQSYAAYYAEQGKAPISELSSGWGGCTPRHSKLTESEIINLAGPNLLPSGLLVVEIYYDHPLILKIPLLTDGNFLGMPYSIIPDPVPVYLYSIMPMSSAEPRSNP